MLPNSTAKLSLLARDATHEAIRLTVRRSSNSRGTMPSRRETGGYGDRTAS